MTEIERLVALRDRLQTAYHVLRGLVNDAEENRERQGLTFSTEVIRLEGKCEGVQVALSFVEEEIRRG